MGFKDATEVVVTGGSAGGLATFSWVDDIAALFDKQNTKVYGLPDSGVFLDMENIQRKDFAYRKLL